MTSHHPPWKWLMVKLILIVSLELSSLFSIELVMDYPVEQQMSDPK